MYLSRSMTFPTPHIGHSRHGLFFTRWIDLPGIGTQDLWSSSQHDQSLHHLNCHLGLPDGKILDGIRKEDAEISLKRLRT
jgi:hypothetical protein